MITLGRITALSEKWPAEMETSPFSFRFTDYLSKWIRVPYGRIVEIVAIPEVSLNHRYERRALPNRIWTVLIRSASSPFVRTGLDACDIPATETG